MYQLVLVLDVVVFAFLVYLIVRKDGQVNDGEVPSRDRAKDIKTVSKARS